MNINISGIQSQLMKNADYLAFLYGGYSRFNGDVGSLVQHYTSGNLLIELEHAITNFPTNLKYKLWDSNQMPTKIFKISAIARLLAEFGIVPSKYKKVLEKVMLGSGAAAITLPGSGDMTGVNAFHASRGHRSASNAMQNEYGRL